MITKVWVIVDSETKSLCDQHFYFSQLAADLTIYDQSMSGLWVTMELTVGERI